MNRYTFFTWAKGKGSQVNQKAGNQPQHLWAAASRHPTTSENTSFCAKLSADTNQHPGAGAGGREQTSRKM